MKKTAIFFGTGYEEVEALTVVDLLRRAGIEVTMVSIEPEREVVSSHQVCITMDACFADCDFSEYDMLILPGGMPGTKNLGACQPLMALLHQFDEQGKYLAAICAAPTVFGKENLLVGKKACCYPDMQDQLIGAEVTFDPVTKDGHMITSRGLGTAIPFGLTLIAELENQQLADEIAKKIVFSV